MTDLLASNQCPFYYSSRQITIYDVVKTSTLSPKAQFYLFPLMRTAEKALCDRTAQIEHATYFNLKIPYQEIDDSDEESVDEDNQRAETAATLKETFQDQLHALNLRSIALYNQTKSRVFLPQFSAELSGEEDFSPAQRQVINTEKAVQFILKFQPTKEVLREFEPQSLALIFDQPHFLFQMNAITLSDLIGLSHSQLEALFSFPLMAQINLYDMAKIDHMSYEELVNFIAENNFINVDSLYTKQKYLSLIAERPSGQQVIESMVRAGVATLRRAGKHGPQIEKMTTYLDMMRKLHDEQFEGVDRLNLMLKRNWISNDFYKIILLFMHRKLTHMLTGVIAGNYTQATKTFLIQPLLGEVIAEEEAHIDRNRELTALFRKRYFAMLEDFARNEGWIDDQEEDEDEADAALQDLVNGTEAEVEVEVVYHHYPASDPLADSQDHEAREEGGTTPEPHQQQLPANPLPPSVRRSGDIPALPASPMPYALPAEVMQAQNPLWVNAVVVVNSDDDDDDDDDDETGSLDSYTESETDELLAQDHLNGPESYEQLQTLIRAEIQYRFQDFLIENDLVSGDQMIYRKQYLEGFSSHELKVMARKFVRESMISAIKNEGYSMPELLTLQKYSKLTQFLKNLAVNEIKDHLAKIQIENKYLQVKIKSARRLYSGNLNNIPLYFENEVEKILKIDDNRFLFELADHLRSAGAINQNEFLRAFNDPETFLRKFTNEKRLVS